jgi:hypothetical protein
MLEAFAKLGVGGLDKVMVAYNAGYYGMRNKVKNQLLMKLLKILLYQVKAELMC